MKVLFASSEIYPLAKTGGLGDVAAALPATLQKNGADIRLLTPAYAGSIEAADAKPLAALGDPFGRGETVVHQGTLPGSDIPLWLVANPHLYERPGGPYQDANGVDWPDNDIRFALLGWSAASLCRDDSPLAWRPDILHLHDWQTGLAPAYLRSWGGTRPRVVFTIHNMAYQGNFHPDLVPRLGLPWTLYTPDGFEFWGRLSYLKSALVYSDKLTTVSPSYAREIQLPGFGFGMDGVVAHRSSDMSGILNGADYSIWDPATDPHLARNYEARQAVAGKAANKEALQAELGLPVDPHAPLLVVISRLNDQKGMDLLLAAMPAVLAQGAQLALLGTGDKRLEEAFRALAVQQRDQVAVEIGYSERLAHRLQAGGDMVLMPSRFEPCGLCQIYGLRYGTLPVVHRTGGLADTVVDATYDAQLQGTSTGFVFDQPTASALQWCIERAIGVYRNANAWRRIQRRAMREDFSWDKAAMEYLELYGSQRPNGAPGKARRRAYV
jgi:starch synthase